MRVRKCAGTHLAWPAGSRENHVQRRKVRLVELLKGHGQGGGCHPLRTRPEYVSCWRCGCGPAFASRCVAREAWEAGGQCSEQSWAEAQGGRLSVHAGPPRRIGTLGLGQTWAAGTAEEPGRATRAGHGWKPGTEYDRCSRLSIQGGLRVPGQKHRE